jgi:DNA polymerase-3 subunit alpha
VDPIKYGLLFERFQNRERKACPDIDSDIMSSGRDRLFEYLKQRWGEERVAVISNVSRMTAKVAIKDIAKSLEIGGDRSKSHAIAEAITTEIPAQVKV